MGKIDPALLDTERNKDKRMFPIFWALDSRVPRYAARAAVEFDWLVRAKDGEPTGDRPRESIEFIERMFDATIAHFKKDGTEAYVGPEGVHLFAEAYERAYGHRPAGRGETAEAIAQVLTLFKKVREHDDVGRDELVRMRAFCIAFSNATAAYRGMIYRRDGRGYRLELAT